MQNTFDVLVKRLLVPDVNVFVFRIEWIIHGLHMILTIHTVRMVYAVYAVYAGAIVRPCIPLCLSF